MRLLPFRVWCVIAMMTITAAGLGGCASTPGAGTATDERDPLEGINRTFYTMNDSLDRAIVGPIAKVYQYLPSPVRTGVGNFFDNLDEPKTAINQLLQGKPQLAIQDSVRFLFNSSFGIGGLIDVSTAMNLPKHDEDFSQTLAVWGLGEGPHLHYPFLGPGSLREVPGRVVDLFCDVLFYVGAFPLTILKLIDIRASIDDVMKLQRESFDPYIFVREAYRQRRNYLIYDGNPPPDEFDDDFDDFDDDFDDDDDDDDGDGDDDT